MFSQPIPAHSFWITWMAALLPLAAFGIIMVFLRRRPKAAAAVSIGGIGSSMLCAAYLLAKHWDVTAPMETTMRWVVSGSLVIPVGALLDPLSLLMLMIVTFIAFLVQFYSLGYMAEDPGFARYFAFMSLFAWAMISLVIAPNILQLFIFWELVGLSSYLLIGFWYEKFSASQAGKKAFIMTRAGDTLFFWGWLILLVWGGTLSIFDLNNGHHNLSSTLVTASGLLVFGGIVGKSAQFPLMTWLPDAMEGPTPVSALLHSATMVAAGVYLFGRLFPYFSQSDVVLIVCLTIGTVSMLLSATMAMVSRDIKQVWAYSTISQLGFMLMALGAGGYVAGIFHLTTHAGFKALLFLCAGALIHVYGTNDMFAIGRGNGRSMKLTVLCMAVGALALSGIWPFSGFYSKEEIMGTLAALDNPIWLAAGFLGVFLTAYYTFRLMFVILFPDRIEAHDEAEGHGPAYAESAMSIVLVVLALVTLVLGFFSGGFRTLLEIPAVQHGGAHAISWVEIASPVLALGGILMAWIEFGRKSAPRIGFAERVPSVRRLFGERWYLDHFYGWVLSRFVDRGAARACQENETRVIEGVIHAICNGVIGSGRAAAGWHRIMIQPKLMVLFASIFTLTLILLILG